MSYNGTHYHGWQVQPNAVTVQATLNKALSVLLKSPTDSMGAGRTDTGVHAVQMVAHFDTKVAAMLVDISNKWKWSIGRKILC